MSQRTDQIEAMITALEAFLLSNVGVGEIVVDGQKIRYERSNALTELKYWRGELAKVTGKRRVFNPINLGGSW